MGKEPDHIYTNGQSKLEIGPDKGGETLPFEEPGPRAWVKDLRPDRPKYPSGPRPSGCCHDCSIHLEGDQWKDKLFRLGGKPLVCTNRHKYNGCGDYRARALKVRLFRAAIERYLADHPEEAATTEEVGSSA